jgi:radical SAM superfamily enzyme YgiQ (UPF0313 family)
MRALLVFPEFPLSFWSFRKAIRLKGAKAGYPPLGLLTVAALLPPDWQVRLADLNVRRLTETDWQWADLIMISAMYIQREGLLALVRQAKARGKIVIAGGPYPTSLPAAALEAGCDFVVRGEAENTMPLLLAAMRRGAAGVIESPEKPDLTASPIPRFDLVRLGDYDSLAIQTTRGCPFDCEFCEVVNFFGRKPRHKTPKQVIAELEALYRLGAAGDVFIVDDNFIGDKAHARALLRELTPWLEKRRSPFTFITQVSVNLGQDVALIDLMTANNLGRVFVGIESPDEQVLAGCHKYHNLKNPLVESIDNLKQNGMTVVGSFILGLDGETPGAGARICSFLEQTGIPISMLGILQAPPHTRLWHRLKREGRLRGDEGPGGGTFAGPNFTPDRPEAEILQEYIDAWDYLYEPSRFLARAYRYYLGMRPTRLALATAKGAPRPKDSLPGRPQTWLSKFRDLRAFLTILWWQGIRPPYRRQFWAQLLGLRKNNPSRFIDYITACAMGEDLFLLRRTVGQEIRAVMQARDCRGAAMESPAGAKATDD